MALGKTDKVVTPKPNPAANLWLMCRALVFPSRTLTEIQRKTYKPDEEGDAAQPSGFVKPSDDVLKEFREMFSGNACLLLTGRSGCGKTTFAIGMLREYSTKPRNGSYQIPVFAPLSKTERPNSDYFTRIVAHKFFGNQSWLGHCAAKSLISTGSLLWIFDDLDYLDRGGYAVLEKFMERFEKNAFLCIVRKRPGKKDSIWDKFGEFSLPEWPADKAIVYITNRITDPEVNRQLLLRKLEPSETLGRSLLAMEWCGVVDVFLNGCIFDIFWPVDYDGPVGFKIAVDYLNIIIKSSGVVSSEAFETLGALALRLLKCQRRTFSPREVDIDRSCLDNLVDKKLFEKCDGDLAFVGGPKQTILASIYLAQFWSTAKADIDGPDSGELAWTSLYNCTSQFIATEHAKELRAVFCKLANPFRKEGIPTAKSDDDSAIDAAPSQPFANTAELGILESSVRASIDKLDIKSLEEINSLGRFSLRLIKDNRKSFTPEEAKMDLGEEMWQKVHGRYYAAEAAIDKPSEMQSGSELFTRHNGTMEFTHTRQQCFLAGRYLGMNWPEAHKNPIGPDTDSAVLTDVALIAIGFIPMELADEFMSRTNELLNPEANALLADKYSRREEELNKRFFALATREAAGSITPDEMKELQDLDCLRRKLHPRTPMELAAEESRKKLFEALTKAWDEYAKSIRITHG
jgi:hypothetical protein